MNAIEKLKERSRKEVTSPLSEVTYRIKMLSQIEFSRCQILPIIPIDDKEPDEKTLMQFIRDNGKRTLDTMQWVLERGVIHPKIFFGPEQDTPADQAHADWLAGDQAWLYSEILKFSGLDEASQDALKDFVKNGNGSEPSMPSVIATASFHTSSFNSDPTLSV